MTSATQTPLSQSPSRNLSVRLVNGLLAIAPLYAVLKYLARRRIIKRAELLGVPWRQQTAELERAIQPASNRTGPAGSSEWQAHWQAIYNPEVYYPDYYLSYPFHAYQRGNMSWDAAIEQEVATLSVHANLWPGTMGTEGDERMRQGYQDILVDRIEGQPHNIVDIGCGIGMSTFALQDCFPDATITGLDLSPYFLSVAHARAETQHRTVSWRHAAAEMTGLPDHSCDLASFSLVFHETPAKEARKIFAEMHRILRPGGYLALMDMNPEASAHRHMPPFVLALLKSTEPFLDDYFRFDIIEAIAAAGFSTPTQTVSSPRHRTIIAQAV